MFLTSLSTAGICAPAECNESRQTKAPSGFSRGASGGGLYYKLFGAVHTFTLRGFATSGGDYSDSPSRPSRASAVKRDTARKYFFW